MLQQQQRPYPLLCTPLAQDLPESAGAMEESCHATSPGQTGQNLMRENAASKPAAPLPNRTCVKNGCQCPLSQCNRHRPTAVLNELLWGLQRLPVGDVGICTPRQWDGAPARLIIACGPARGGRGSSLAPWKIKPCAYGSSRWGMLAATLTAHRSVVCTLRSGPS